MKKTFVFSICAAMTLLAACNESENWTPNTSCSDAEARCDSDKLYTCKDGEWVLGINCADNGMVCGQNAENQPACVSGPKEECTPSCVNGVLTTCDENMKASTKACSDENKICGVNEHGVPACVEAVVCAFGETNVLVGTKVCDAEGRVVECQADGTMSEGTACTDGVCSEGKCVRRGCDDVADGKNVCKENKLMVCNDGELIEDTENACGTDTPLCRDGESACSAYQDCDTIEHGQNGCKDGNIVLCNDGKMSVIDGGDCVSNGQFCIADVTADGFICKTPDPTDCAWNGGLVAKNETVCDGNVLKTCSADKDGELSEGMDCASVNNGKPLCDSKLNICRAYYNCGDNEEIEHEAVVCNAKGTNKAKCNDGKLVDLTDGACAAVDNANTICTYDTEAACGFECKPGYFLKNDACEPIVTCDAVKEKYHSDDNTCSCNTDAHWTGTAGNCDCAEGYLKIGNTCEEKKTCSDAHNDLDETTNTCVCDFNGNWIGKADSCQCKDGFVEIGGECKSVVPCTEDHAVWEKSSNSCVCDSSKGWTGDAGSCACADGFVNVNGVCVRKVVCNANETWVEADNTCACNTEKGWTGTAGSCTCSDSAQVPAGDKCEDKVTCSDGQTYVDGLNVCACDSAKGWISDGTSCVCPTGYFAKDGVCTPKTVCNTNETWGETDNTCACDEANGWTGTAGSCTCDADKNLVQVGNACVEKAACTGDGQIYIENANVCACDSAKSWISDGTSCVCPTGYFAKDGVCIPKAICDLNREKYVESTNTCECNSDKGWSGTAGNCTCANGLAFIDNQCIELTKGDHITFGHYEQDNDTSNGQEPIIWRVLDKNADGQYLLISEKALDVQPYNTTYISITWEKSTIRSWLNGYDQSYNTVGSYTSDNFIDAAFTTTEKAKIVSSNVPAHANPYYDNTSPGNATTDRIFLLSITEAQNYFTNSDNSKADATRYAVKKGAYVLGSESGKHTSNGTCTDAHCSPLWWLRSPGSFDSDAAFVDDRGSFSNMSNYVNANNIAVRPALWVNF